MRLILIGPPGAGKGTQIARISEYYDIHTISTGEILREQAMLDTPLGNLIARQINSGSYVSDEIVLELVKDRIMSADYGRGFVFDGFPRTLKQAEELWDILRDNALWLDKAVFIDVPDEVIVERMAGRTVCLNCDRSYNTRSLPPKVTGVCDNCGHKLRVREDDSPETVKRRLAIYRELTEPIINYYKDRGMLLAIDGARQAREITEEILEKLETVKNED